MDPNLAELRGRLKQLSTEFRELREDFGKAINLAEQDPEMALTRSRRVLEAVVRDVFERHVGEPAGTRPLENLIQRIVKDGYFPRRLEAYANTVRGLGNLGAHGLENVARADVVHSLSLLMAILEWYFENERPASLAPGAPEAPAPRRAKPKSSATGRVSEPRSAARAQPQVEANDKAPARTRRWLIPGVVAASALVIGIVAVVSLGGSSRRRSDPEQETKPKPQPNAQVDPPAAELLPFLSVGPRMVAPLLSSEEVHRELKLSDQQAARADGLAERLMEKSRDEFQKLQEVPAEEQPQRRHAMARRINADLAESLASVFTPEQRRRFEQICLQYGIVQALGDPVIGSILKLTDQQKAMVRELETGSRERTVDIVRGAQGDHEATSKAMVAHRKRVAQRALRILTEVQRSKWQDLAGAPFEITRPLLPKLQ